MCKRLFVFLFLFASPAFADVGSCPISADFVVEPETSETTQQMGQLEVTSTTMRSFVDGGMVLIECMGIDANQLFPEMNDANILTNYARFWSIQPTGPAFKGEEPVKHLAIEGVKDIQGIEVTYTYRLFRFKDSFAMVATGVPGGRPTAEVLQFLESISLREPEPFTDKEKREGLRNHIASCLPAVRADNETRQLGLSDVEVTYFCSCTGQRYFAEFTRPDLRALAFGDDAALEQRRVDIQTECFEEALK